MRVLSRVFRAKYRDGLRRLFDDGRLVLPDQLRDPAAFVSWLAEQFCGMRNDGPAHGAVGRGASRGDPRRWIVAEDARRDRRTGRMQIGGIRRLAFAAVRWVPVQFWK